MHLPCCWGNPIRDLTLDRTYTVLDVITIFAEYW